MCTIIILIEIITTTITLILNTFTCTNTNTSTTNSTELQLRKEVKSSSWSHQQQLSPKSTLPNQSPMKLPLSPSFYNHLITTMTTTKQIPIYLEERVASNSVRCLSSALLPPFCHHHQVISIFFSNSSNNSHHHHRHRQPFNLMVSLLLLLLYFIFSLPATLRQIIRFCFYCLPRGGVPLVGDALETRCCCCYYLWTLSCCGCWWRTLQTHILGSLPACLSVCVQFRLFSGACQLPLLRLLRSIYCSSTVG